MTLEAKKRSRLPRISITAVLLALIIMALPAWGAKELLKNGDLSLGSGGQPDDWRTEAWVNEPSAVSFTWTRPDTGGRGELHVEAIKPDDARWMESLSLAPGWYYFSAEIRTENIGAQNSGATLSVMEDGIMSPEVKGTSNWTKVGFYLKVGAKGADIEVACRIGGFGSLNTGKAWYRNARVTLVASPPAGAQPIYDLEAIRKAAEPVPIGSPFSMVLTYLVLAAIAYAGWYVFGLQPPKVARAEIRREARKAARR